MYNPLCFVIMPFGIKKDSEGNEINFDEIYNSLIKPAINSAKLSPIRADEETMNGIIHKPMYERLILCDYAIADLTTANANVFYELGIRHAVKPYTTITIFSSNSKLPFDVNFLRSLPYDYDTKEQVVNMEKNRKALIQQLLDAKKEKYTDSPVYQLVEGISFQNSVAHEKTDIFRDRVKYNTEIKNLLVKARNTQGEKIEKLKAVDKIVNNLVLENEEAGVLIDVMLSYRAIGAIENMIDFIERLPLHVQQTVMVQEQLGFALNRNKQHDEAIAVLEKVLKENGPGSETYGILGRVYKDLFDEARINGNDLLAESYLDKALETYLKGFKADWRDAYPGINALTLLELKGDRAAIKKLAPVVEYAVFRKLETKTTDYWDYATLLELAVIENNETKARENFIKAISCPIEGNWLFDTTIKNLNLIKLYREKRNEENEIPLKMVELLESQKKSC
jgi:tetratricopeptide (TPR) repeat protein